MRGAGVFSGVSAKSLNQKYPRKWAVVRFPLSIHSGVLAGFLSCDSIKTYQLVRSSVGLFTSGLTFERRQLSGR